MTNDKLIVSSLSRHMKHVKGWYLIGGIFLTCVLAAAGFEYSLYFDTAGADHASWMAKARVCSLVQGYLLIILDVVASIIWLRFADFSLPSETVPLMDRNRLRKASLHVLFRAFVSTFIPFILLPIVLLNTTHGLAMLRLTNMPFVSILQNLTIGLALILWRIDCWLLMVFLCLRFGPWQVRYAMAGAYVLTGFYSLVTLARIRYLLQIALPRWNPQIAIIWLLSIFLVILVTATARSAGAHSFDIRIARVD